MAIVGLFIGFFAVGQYPLNYSHSISKGQKIDANFRDAAKIVEDFRHRSGRLPTREELAGLQDGDATSLYAVGIQIGGFDQCEDDSPYFRNLSEDEYVLTVWRGEWLECFAPKTQKSSVTLDYADYSVTGSLQSDRFVFGFAALGCFFVVDLPLVAIPARLIFISTILSLFMQTSASGKLLRSHMSGFRHLIYRLARLGNQFSPGAKKTKMSFQQMI